MILPDHLIQPRGTQPIGERSGGGGGIRRGRGEEVVHRADIGGPGENFSDIA